MQINRLFEIIYLLLDKEIITAKELAERFEVSTRTIYRDIENLSAGGIPVYMTKGKGGGVSLLPNFVLNKTILTVEEKKNILSSLQAIKAVSLSDTDTALLKLSGLFGSVNTNWIEVDFSDWVNTAEETEIFQTAKTAILEKKVIIFEYASGMGQSIERVVEPLKLCFKRRAWYMYGYCRLRNDFRLFKLRRIKGLIIAKESFLREAPSEIFTKHNVFQEEYCKLKLKLSPQMAYRIYDEFEHYEIQEDGSFIVEITYPKGVNMLYYIATFGASCQVLEPFDIRMQVKIELEKTLDQYL